MLIGVIIRFRLNEVAVAADIKRMFHQVYVAPEDCGALCYLWWPGGDLKEEPETHQMLVHIFGATSLPSVAGYALRKTARDNERDFSSETVEAAFEDFYVDDQLKSFINTKTNDRHHEATAGAHSQRRLSVDKGDFQLSRSIVRLSQRRSEHPLLRT